MSVSEQEAKQQIAQMRHALESMKASARRSSYVRIVGVIVGFAIVIVYVALFIHLGMNLSKSEKFKPIVEERLKTLGLQETAVKVVEKALPTYLEAGKDMLSKMDLTPAEEQASALLQDLRPMLASEANRMWPKLQDALILQGNAGAKEAETKLQAMLDKRLQAMIEKHSSQIQSQTGLTEAQTAQVMHNINEAGKQAMLSIIQKRWSQNEGKLEKIAGLVDTLPALPAMSESELLEKLRDVLIALVKAKLPDYNVEDELGKHVATESSSSVVGKVMRPEAAVAGPKVTAPAHPGPTAAEKVKMLEDQLKQPGLSDEQRQNIQKQLDKEKAAMNKG